MTYVIGIDPGKTGAVALYGADGSLSCWDMPTHKVPVGNSLRDRVDPWGMYTLMQQLSNIAELAVIEAVGGMPRQSAGGAFVFGFSTAIAYCAVLYHRIPIEAVTPATWKRWLKVPGKAQDTGAVMKRAGEMFPQHAELFRGPNGGKRVDRAEAAMMARFGLEVLLSRPKAAPPAQDVEGFLTRGGQ